jgi:aspartate/glutamate racemase
MGASTIVLFGCDFDNSKQHYFYKTNVRGSISNNQRTVMNEVIKELKKRGVQIKIVGSTTLQC